MNQPLNPILLELRREFEVLYGKRLAQMILFGSQARGDAVAGSDIDVLVVLRGQVDAGAEIARTGQIIADLSLRENVVIACVFMSEDRFLCRNGPLLRNVRREGVPV